jgi:hypothetical protein
MKKEEVEKNIRTSRKGKIRFHKSTFEEKVMIYHGILKYVIFNGEDIVQFDV